MVRQDAVPVLVVDDNLGFLRVVQAILEKATPPFSVHTVESGTEALAFLERRPPFDRAPRPAFIVLDFHLPDMDAPSVLDRIGARAELREIPVLVLSQAAWEEDEAAARRAGARQFGVKPSRVAALRDAVVTFWKEHAHGGEDPTD
jgi:CheY-like chemotaxis protein